MTQPSEIHKTESDTWFVIWAEARAEKKVEERLAALGLAPWLPFEKERHRWSDRWRDVECPLFPDYLFARASSANWHRILRTRVVVTVRREGGKPAMLSDAFVAALRDAIGREGGAPEVVNDRANHSRGSEVIVLEGALLGVRGIVSERRGWASTCDLGD